MGDIRLVLVIDGNKASASVTIEALDSIGVKEVKYIGDLEEAKAFLAKEKVIFIVIDSFVKRQSTIGFIKWLRTNYKNPNYRVPILFMMGVPTKEEVTNARDAGVTEFMVKPFQVENFKTVILSFLKNPRNFIISRGYVGPDRRRRDQPPPEEGERRTQIIESDKKD